MKTKYNHAIRYTLFVGLSLTTTVVMPKTTKSPCTSSASTKKFPATAHFHKKYKGTIKEQQWHAMEQQVASWGDALGMGIDPEIKNTVIVLNLLGFKTEQSCQGHLDSGLPYPWISFDTEDKEINALKNERRDIGKLIHENEVAIQKKYPTLSLGEALRKDQSAELMMLYQKMHPLNDAIDRLSSLKLIRLNNLMTEFYKKRSIGRDRMLAFQGLDRIYSLGGRWQITRNDDEKLEKLKEYQEEMRLFTDFLTQYYFEK